MLSFAEVVLTYFGLNGLMSILCRVTVAKVRKVNWHLKLIWKDIVPLLHVYMREMRDALN